MKILNERQQKYKKNRIAGMNGYRAAIAAGYSHNTAINVYRNIEKRLPFKDFLIKKGIDDDKIAQVMNEGLEATKVISANVIAPSGEGMADAHGTTKDFIDVPDYATRHKYMETALKLQDKLKEKVDINANIKVVEMRSIEIVHKTEGSKRLEFDLG